MRSMDIYGEMFNSMGALTGDEAAFFGGFMIVWLVAVLFSYLFSILSYVLQSLGFYAIAKRRGIHNPWMAWIPVVNLWTLGSIADQYQYVAKGRVRSYRKVLLGLQIAMVGATVLFTVFSITAGVFAGMADSVGAAVGSMIGPVLVFVVLYLAFFALAIVLSVFQYIALYNLFASCDPNNAVVFLVLSILINVTLPFFVFAVRKKDKGMPPRRQPNPVVPQMPEEVPVAEETPVSGEVPIVEAVSVEEAPAEPETTEE